MPQEPTSDSPVELRFEKFSAFVEGYAPYLSLGGMFLGTDDLRPVGSTVGFEVGLNDGFRLLQGVGQVIWVRLEDEGPERPAGMGVRFQALDDKGRELILKVIEERVRSGGEPFDVEVIPPGTVSGREGAPEPEPVARSEDATVLTSAPVVEPEPETEEATILTPAPDVPVSEEEDATILSSAPAVMEETEPPAADLFELEPSEPAPAEDEVFAPAPPPPAAPTAVEPSAPQPPPTLQTGSEDGVPGVDRKILGEDGFTLLDADATAPSLSAAPDAKKFEELEFDAPWGASLPELPEEVLEEEQDKEPALLEADAPAMDLPAVGKAPAESPREELRGEELDDSFMAAVEAANEIKVATETVAGEPDFEEVDFDLTLGEDPTVLSGPAPAPPDVGAPPAELLESGDISLEEVAPFEAVGQTGDEAPFEAVAESTEGASFDTPGVPEWPESFAEASAVVPDQAEAVGVPPAQPPAPPKAEAAPSFASVDEPPLTFQREEPAPYEPGPVDDIGTVDDVGTVGDVQDYEEDLFAEEPGSGAGSLLRRAFAGSRWLLVVAAVLLALAGAGYFLREQILDLLGLGPSPVPTAAGSRPAPVPADQGSPSTPEQVVESIDEPVEPVDVVQPAALEGIEGSVVSSPEDDPSAADSPSTASLPADPSLAGPDPAALESATGSLDGAGDPPAEPGADRETPAASTATTASASRIERITWRRSDAGTVIVLSLDGQLSDDRYLHSTLSYTPEREMVKVTSMALPYVSGRIEVGSPEVRQIRTGFHSEGADNAIHVVIDYPGEGPRVTSVRNLGDRLEILVAGP